MAHAPLKRDPNSVLIYKMTSSSPCAAGFWIISHTQSCAVSKEAENKTKHNQTTFTTQNIRTLTEPLASHRVKWVIVRFAAYEWISKPFSDENNMYLPSCSTYYIHTIAMINLKKKQTRVCLSWLYFNNSLIFIFNKSCLYYFPMEHIYLINKIILKW